MSSNDLDTTLKEYISCFQKRCPHFAPAIYPSSYCPKNLDALCKTSNQKKHINEWMNEQNNSHDYYAFHTSINLKLFEVRIERIENCDSTDYHLNSLEYLMKLITSGEKNEINIFVERYIELNQLDVDFDEGNKLFYEMINLGYSIKVLISNIPGLKVTFEGKSLPLPSSCDIKQLLTQHQYHLQDTYKNINVDFNDSNKKDSTNITSKNKRKHHIEDNASNVTTKSIKHVKPIKMIATNITTTNDKNNDNNEEDEEHDNDNDDEGNIYEDNENNGSQQHQIKSTSTSTSQKKRKNRKRSKA